MSFYLVKTSNFIQKWLFSIEQLSKNTKKKIVFYGKTLKIHEKVVKISKKLV